MPKDVAARKRIKELEGAIAIVAESNVRMSAIIIKCSRAFETLIEKGLITNDEINKAIIEEKEENDSNTDSEDTDKVSVQSERDGTNDSNS